jgi:GAF domain-containing protein
LESDEYCLWIVAELMTVEQARDRAPRLAARLLHRYLADSRLEIVSGLSLLTRDGKRPDAYGKGSIGQLSPACGVRTSEVEPRRNFGPCGGVLDQNRTLLFRHFERHYLYLRPATPLAEEGLLVPFYVNGKAVGTLWAIAHNDSRKFDAEDLRLLQSLGRFASAGIDVTTIRQRGQFELRTWTDTHLRDGEFNQDKTLALFEAVVKNSKEQGFALIRFATHMEWASENRPGVGVSSSLCAKPEE